MTHRRHAMDNDQYWDHRPGDPVMTVDGYPGTVTEVSDGPVPGNENYRVELHNGMGGGDYSSGQLSALTHSRTASGHEAAGLHVASEDYPELGEILYERPDPGKLTFAAAQQAAEAPEEGAQLRDTDQPDSCSYCGSRDFTGQTDNGRVKQATCATCGGTMSAHPGAQWTPELIGDPSNHPSTTVDPASGASGAGGTAGVNDLIDFDSRVSTSAAKRRTPSGPTTAGEQGISHVYRGVHGQYAEQAAEAHRHGEVGHGMYGPGVYTTSSPDLAVTYAQAHMGDHTGVFMHGQVRPDASVGRLDEVPKHVQHGTETHWAREQGHDVLSDGGNTHIVVNPHAVTWDPKNYSTGEAYKKFNRWGEDYNGGPADLHTAALAGHDWCTWRREARCTFPGDSTAVSLAIPQDRGPCPWETPWQQQVCPISEPGPMALMHAKGSLTAEGAIPAGPCPECGGKGHYDIEEPDPDYQEKPDIHPDEDPDAYRMRRETCEDCGGAGHVDAVSDEELAQQRVTRAQSLKSQIKDHLDRVDHPDGVKTKYCTNHFCPYPSPRANKRPGVDLAEVMTPERQQRRDEAMKQRAKQLARTPQSTAALHRIAAQMRTALGTED